MLIKLEKEEAEIEADDNAEVVATFKGAPMQDKKKEIKETEADDKSEEGEENDITFDLSDVTYVRKLLEKNDEDINEAMKLNICRCGTYQRIRKAIKSAAKSINNG